jgi:hypothetical protein
MNAPTLITARGITLSLRGWAKYVSVSRQAIQYRLKIGWDIELALFTPDDRRANYDSAQTWTCNKCGPLHVSMFHKYSDVSSPHGWRYYGRCIECNKVGAKIYGVADRERRNARLAKWRKENRLSAREIDRRRRHRRRARVLDATSPGVTSSEWLQVCEHFSFRCAYCGEPGTTIDHVIPISRGGRDAPDNVVPACHPCNSSKGAKLLHEWNQCHADALLDLANK